MNHSKVMTDEEYNRNLSDLRDTKNLTAKNEVSGGTRGTTKKVATDQYTADLEWWKKVSSTVPVSVRLSSSWDVHAAYYIEQIKDLIARHDQERKKQILEAIGPKYSPESYEEKFGKGTFLRDAHEIAGWNDAMTTAQATINKIYGSQE